MAGFLVDPDASEEQSSEAYEEEERMAKEESTDSEDNYLPSDIDADGIRDPTQSIEDQNVNVLEKESDVIIPINDGRRALYSKAVTRDINVIEYLTDCVFLSAQRMSLPTRRFGLER